MPVVASGLTLTSLGLEHHLNSTQGPGFYMPLLPHHTSLPLHLAATAQPEDRSGEEKKLTILAQVSPNDTTYNHDETFPNSIDNQEYQTH